MPHPAFVLTATAADNLCAVQAFAPLSSAEAGSPVPERLLFVFGCARKGCAPSPTSWRAMRCQVPAASPQHSPAATPASASTAQPRSCAEAATDIRGCGAEDSAQAAAPVSDDWGAGGDDWGTGAADWNMEEPLDWRPTYAPSDGGAFDFADLDAALDASTLNPKTLEAAVRSLPPAAGVQSAGASRDPFGDAMEESPSQAATGSPAALTGEPGAGLPVSGGGVPVSGNGAPISCSGPCGLPLPAFYLQAQPEPAAEEALGLRAAPGEEAHVHELLQRYGQEDAKVRRVRALWPELEMW